MSVIAWLDRLNPLSWISRSDDNEPPSAIAVDPATGQQSQLDLSPIVAEQYEKAALLSTDVFNDTGAPEGFTRLSASDLIALGLRPEDFSVDKLGFDAALYRDNATGQYSLAFRGSESGSWSDIKEDWLMTNMGQIFGDDVPAAYEQARLLTGNVKDVLGDEVLITGHSMGGGLANYAAVAHNLDYTIFNAAGLSNTTIDALGENVSLYTGNGVVINDQYDPLTNFGGKLNGETWGGKHAGHDTLIFVDNNDFNGFTWLTNLLDPGRREQAHCVENNIVKFLAHECDRWV
jgi:hypothetical protein